MFSRSVYSPGGPPSFFALMFIIVPVIFILSGWAFAACLFLAGRYLANRTHRLFCLKNKRNSSGSNLKLNSNSTAGQLLQLACEVAYLGFLLTLIKVVAA